VGGKAQAGAAPAMRTASGPPLVSQSEARRNAIAQQGIAQNRDTTAKAAATVGSIVAGFFYGPEAALATSIMANRATREVYNVSSGRPFFESTSEPTKDWKSLLVQYGASAAGGYAGGALGGAAGSAAGGATGEAVGKTAGSYAGSAAAGYGANQALLSAEGRSQNLGQALGRMLGNYYGGGAFGELSRRNTGYGQS
jgi:hypothetical protein